MVLKALLLTAAGFASGSLMFSAWLAKLRGRDIGRFGDANPGAVNAFKAGGWQVGVPALLLDFLKAAVPVGVGRWLLGIEGWWLVPVALAPVLGHAFTPFLGFHGGRAITATFGIWCGLTLWEGPTVLGFGFGLAGLVLAADAWTVMFGMATLFVYWLLRRAEPAVYAVWAGNLAVVAWKHRRGLGQGLRFRRWLRGRR